MIQTLYLVSANPVFLVSVKFQISPHVDGGVESGLGSLLLLSRRVDGGQRLTRGLAGGADLLAFGHGESASLVGEELFQFKWSGPGKASLAEGGGSHEG